MKGNNILPIDCAYFQVLDINESPTAITLSKSSVGEHAVPGEAVGVFSTSDPDRGQTFTYAIVEPPGIGK